MKLHLAKRVGMLAASTAVLTAGIFGALSLNGLRYVRVTAENWWLLPYVRPAARVEQKVIYTDNMGDGQRENSVYSLTGYDEQERELWECVSWGRFRPVNQSWTVRTGDTETTYLLGGNGKEARTTVYDAQNRRIREESGGFVYIYRYRGEETELYLSEMYNEQGVLVERDIRETNADTGKCSVYEKCYDENGQFSGTVQYLLDSHGNTVSWERTDADGTAESRTYQWSYNDAERTETCVNEDGEVHTTWYDEQGRTVRNVYTYTDGTQSEGGFLYTDVTCLRITEKCAVSLKLSVVQNAE